MSTTSRRLRRKGQYACDFCRIRKLRCDRPFPCTSCRSRGKTCRIGIEDPTPLVEDECGRSVDGLSHTGATPVSVLQISSFQQPDSLPIATIAQPQLLLPEELLADVQALRRMTQQLEQRVLQSTTSQQRQESVTVLTPENSTRSDSLLALRSDTTQVSDIVAHLQCVSMSRSFPDTTHADELVLKIGRIQTLSEAPTYASQPDKPVPCIWLPYHAEAKILVDSYIEELDYIQHIMHQPSLPATIDAVYRQIDKLEPVHPGRLVLLLSIIASATHVWVPRVDSSSEHSLFLSAAQANAQTPLWIRATHNVLHATQYIGTPTLEMIQGIIILSFVVANLEGVSMRYRSLISTALLLSREMNLHRLDASPNTAGADGVQIETSRRVWWYLVATDWLLAARYGGPGEGVYHCHPQHMQIRKPRNINNGDLLDHDLLFEHPASHPTDMSYFLQRIRLAETARTIVDRNLMSPAGCRPTVDLEIDHLLNNLPPFFRLSNYEYDTHSVPNIDSNLFIQTYMLTSLIHTQRCKTHLTHLTVNSTSSSSSSRAICLESARHILAAERILLRSRHSFVRVRLRLTAILYGIFIACVALIMDICVHSPTTLEDELRHGEIADALRILEGAKGYSLAAEKVWDGLMGAVDRYRKKTQQGLLQRSENCPPIMGAELDGSIWGEGVANQGIDVQDEIAQGGEQDVANEWYDLFSDLSSSSPSSFF